MTFYRSLPLLLAIILTGVATTASAALPVIKPGARWYDNRGRLVQAHGGCIVRWHGAYYLFGEDRSRKNPPHRRCVSCYRSTDLAHWTYRGRAVVLANPDRKVFPGRWILERPKVLYNRLTQTFVMYTHIDSGRYQAARVAVLASQTIVGPYRFIRSFQPLGHQSRDIGAYQAANGKAYLLFEDRPFGFRIAQLSRDYLRVKKQICLIAQHLEGLGLVHYHGLYYVVGSHLTSWAPNPDVYATAKHLAGPWSKFHNIAPPSTRTWNSQSGYLLKIVGSQHTAVIYLGDRWNPQNLWDSRYIWMPLKIGQGKLKLPHPQPWTINTITGEVKLLPSSP